MTDTPQWFNALRAAFEPASAEDYGRIFNTYWFIVFAGITVTMYWILRNARLRLGFLGVACVVFHYHFAGPAGMLPIIALGIVTYLLGLTRSRLARALGITLSVLALCFYKYLHFFANDALGLINPQWGPGLETSAKHLLPRLPLSAGGLYLFVPPLGMSFFAFEFVHYLYEVRKGAAPITNPLRFLLFAIFFPSLVAGPIKRYGQFVPALESGAQSVGLEDVSVGLRRIAMGFLKKIVIADNLTLAIDYYVPQFAHLALSARWTVFLLIALRILLDFSGYSDIAIGVARLLGIVLPENFNWPYAATSIQEFWQRWHISLSSWIRDYVYIPLGGNRHGTARRILNGLIAFALVGLWHGPAWHFVIWGLYHGLGLALCAGYAQLPGIGPRLQAFLAPRRRTCWLATQLFAWIGWLIFFYPVSQAWAMTTQLFVR
ncbi:MAG TPA: MBOAT family O-acyltransferase [Opitutaceae bacterium]|nr:MBOAT family O-acyltransferase [Opitutaceae bacterium]